MTLNELKALLDEACLDEYRCGCYDIEEIDIEAYEKHGLEVVEEEDWTQDGKYQHAATIIKDNEGNFFCLNNNRSGSCHSDWYYGEPNICQVKKVTKMVEVTSWEVV